MLDSIIIPPLQMIKSQAEKDKELLCCVTRLGHVRVIWPSAVRPQIPRLK